MLIRALKAQTQKVKQEHVFAHPDWQRRYDSDPRALSRSCRSLSGSGFTSFYARGRKGRRPLVSSSFNYFPYDIMLKHAQIQVSETDSFL